MARRGNLAFLAVVAISAAPSFVVACSTFSETGSDAGPGSPDGAPGSDAATDAVVETAPPPSDVGADAPPKPRCDRNAAFVGALPVPGIPIPTANDYSAYVSPDELYILVSTDRDGSSYTHYYEAFRTDSTLPFVGMRKLMGFGGAGESDETPTFRPKSNTFVYCREQVSIPAAIFGVPMADGGASGTPLPITDLKSVGDRQCHVHYARHAPELWFSAFVPGAGWQIYRAREKAALDGFDPPVPVSELNNGVSDSWVPVVSDDGLTVYFGSNRADPAALGLHDLWMATRSDPNGTFGAPRLVSELSSAADEWPAFASADDCRLYFVTGASGKARIMVATRPAPTPK